MRKLRLGKVAVGIAASAAALTLSAVPASAAVYDYEFTTTGGTLEFYDLFDQPVATVPLSGGGGTECVDIPNTLVVDDTADTFAATIASDSVTQVAGIWFRAELVTTVGGDFTGTGPYAVNGTGSAVAELRRVSGPTDCTPDNPGQVCTVTAANVAFAGSLDDNGHGIANLALTDTAEFDGSNFAFETSVTDTGTECGGVAALDNGYVNVVDATISNFA